MNRTLKRPMFRIGGPVNQGTGIMSHVEPKYYVMGGRVGFRVGGIGVSNLNYPDQFTLPQFQSGLGILQRNNGLGNLGDYSTSNETTPIKPSIIDYNRELMKERGITPSKYLLDLQAAGEPKIQKGWFGETSLEKSMREKKEANPSYTPFYYNAAEKAQLGQSLNAARDQEKLYDSGVNVMEGADRPAAVPVAKNKPSYDETNKTDPKAEIKKDAALLKELMHGEDYQDMTKGEIALIVARALAEPGSIGNKIRVANELAIPVIKARKSEDKESVLEAYKAYREREKAEIAAGKQGTLEKDARAMTAAYINANPNDPNVQTAEGRSKIYNDMFEQRLSGEMKIGARTKWATWAGQDKQTVDSLRKQKDTLEELQKNKGKLPADKQKEYDDILIKLNRYKQTYPEQFKEYSYATGGRVKLADGTSDPEDQDTTSTTPDKTIESTTTSADAGTQQTQLKPVVKLSFQELRTRLPKEITNDIVNLIANSQEALQDFAYIKTQQDVNNFNVKYGVNLVLPSNR